MHLPDDLAIIEPVDRYGNVVAPGQPADKVLLTNLYNRTQPLIRYEITDAMTVVAGTCECGCATGESPTWPGGPMASSLTTKGLWSTGWAWTLCS